MKTTAKKRVCGVKRQRSSSSQGVRMARWQVDDGERLTERVCRIKEVGGQLRQRNYKEGLDGERASRA